MSGPMTEPREALATSICSTFDMGHHHHEAFLQPDHCDDGLSDADELLRSLRAQGYSVARSEGPGLDALREARKAMSDRHDDLMWCNKDDDCHIQAKGVEVAIADFDAALAAQENPTPVRSTPSLDEGLLARALRTSSVGPYREGDLWTPDAWFAAYARSVAREYRRLAQEGETP